MTTANNRMVSLTLKFGTSLCNLQRRNVCSTIDRDEELCRGIQWEKRRNKTDGTRRQNSESISTADFGTATLPPDLRGAILSYDNLNGANLSKADLSHADLTYALLQGAILSGANLRFADLSNAQYLTQQQLDQVSTCKGAILPKGLTCNHNQ